MAQSKPVRFLLVVIEQGWGACGQRTKCGLHEHLIWPASGFALLELEHNIALKRNSMTSRHVNI